MQSPEALLESRKRKRVENPDKIGVSSSSPTLQQNEAAVDGPKSKKKKNKSSNERPSVFAFDSADLRSRSKPISITDLRQVVMSVMEHNMPSQERPKFISTPGRSSVKRMAVLCIPGITPDIIGMPTPPQFTVAVPQSKLHPRSLFAGVPSSKKIISTSSELAAPAFPLTIGTKKTDTQLPALSKLFSHGLPTRAEGEGTRLFDTIGSFLIGTSKIPKKDNSRANAALFGEQSTTIEGLLLSPSELTQEGLEFKTSTLNGPSNSLHRIANGWDATWISPASLNGWVQAPHPASNISPSRPIALAIDCEMVDTKDGKGLARIAVVDFWNENLLMDELVKPSGEVTDYLTQYSGMTSELLESITTTLADVQTRLLALMRDSNAIIIGHHISNDLRALKLVHARCIDTSVAYHNLQRPSSKPSLKWLAQRWLGTAIQASGKVDSDGSPILGHRPEEDARACVALVKMKIEQGLAFGKVQEDKSSIFTRLKASNLSSAYVGSEAVKSGVLATTVIEKPENEVLEAVITALSTHDFVFGRVHSLVDALGWSNSSPTSSPTENDLTAFKTLNGQIKQFASSLPPSTALIIYTGSADPRAMGALNKRKATWDAKIRSGIINQAASSEERWTIQDAESLEKECEKTKAGLAFFCVTLGGI